MIPAVVGAGLGLVPRVVGVGPQVVLPPARRACPVQVDRGIGRQRSEDSKLIGCHLFTLSGWQVEVDSTYRTFRVPAVI